MGGIFLWIQFTSSMCRVSVLFSVVKTCPLHTLSIDAQSPLFYLSFPPNFVPWVRDWTEELFCKTSGGNTQMTCGIEKEQKSRQGHRSYRLLLQFWSSGFWIPLFFITGWREHIRNLDLSSVPGIRNVVRGANHLANLTLIICVHFGNVNFQLVGFNLFLLTFLNQSFSFDFWTEWREASFQEFSGWGSPTF